MRDSLNFLISGVGGQGIILASDVLVNVGLSAGYDAKQAEVHGMSQRGGSVTSFVRWGKKVYSPLVGAGEVDILLSFEKLEALRVLNQLHPGAVVLINEKIIEPLTVLSGSNMYPSDTMVKDAFEKVTPYAEFVDGERIAKSLGNSRVVNVVLLGSLSVLIERFGVAGPKLNDDVWLKVISENIQPRLVDINRKAFLAGKAAIKEKSKIS